MKKDFIRINIPRLPLLTTEEGIQRIRTFFGKLSDWKNLRELIPKECNESRLLKKTGLAGIFSASLELTREGLIKMMQKKDFDKLLIKEKNE